MKAPLLELYFFESCPYCQRVLKVINEFKIHVTYKDIYGDANNMAKLFQITGSKMVPCLFIDGHPMHESLDIMNWLKSNREKLDKTE